MVGGNVHIHAGQPHGAALGVALGHRAARHDPAPLPGVVFDTKLGFVRVLQPHARAGEVAGRAFRICRVSPGKPALPHVRGTGVVDAKCVVEMPLAAILLALHQPFPAPAVERIEGEAQLLLPLSQGFMGLTQGLHGVHAPCQQLPARAQQQNARPVVPGQPHQRILQGRGRRGGATHYQAGVSDGGQQGCQHQHADPQARGAVVSLRMPTCGSARQACTCQHADRSAPVRLGDGELGRERNGGGNQGRQGPEVQPQKGRGRGVHHHRHTVWPRAQAQQHQRRHPTTDQTRNQLAAPAGAQQLTGLQPSQGDDNKDEQAASQQQKRNHETGGRRRALKPSSAHDSGF